MRESLKTLMKTLKIWASPRWVSWKMRKSLGTLVDCSSPLPGMGITQVSELKDEGVPEDPHEDPQDMGFTQVSELKMRESLKTLMKTLKIWASPRWVS
jgi:hypothetical protein